MMIRLILCSLLILGTLSPFACGATDQDGVATQAGATPNIIQYLDKDGSFKILLAVIKAADFTETLSGTNDFTILAPTDDAFKKLPDGYLQSLMLPSGKQRLAGLLGLHLISGKVTVAQLFVNNSVKTYQGQELSLDIMAGNYMLDEAKLIQANVPCSNGLVDVVDRVLMPFP